MPAISALAALPTLSSSSAAPVPDAMPEMAAVAADPQPSARLVTSEPRHRCVALSQDILNVLKYARPQRITAIRAGC